MPCKICIKELRKDNKSGYCRRCSHINPERKINLAAWVKANGDKIKTNKADYRRINREKINVGWAIWAKANPEKVKTYSAAYRKANPEKCKAAIAIWDRANPSKKNSYTRKRQAAKLKRTPSWLTKEHYKEIEQFYRIASQFQSWTKIKLEVDHIIPLQGKIVSGLHVPWNLQILPVSINRSKGNRH